MLQMYENIFHQGSQKSEIQYASTSSLIGREFKLLIIQFSVNYFAVQVYRACKHPDQSSHNNRLYYN